MELFQPDNFSTAEITYRPSSRQPGFFYPILRRYIPNCQIESVAELEHPAFNTENFKVVLSDGVARRVVLVRKYKSIQPEQINFYVGIIDQLLQGGVAAVHFLKTADADRPETQYDGAWYAVADFIEARHFFPTQENYAASARAIARLHRALQALPPATVERVDQLSQQGYTYFNIVKQYTVSDFEYFKEFLAKHPAPTQTERLVLEHIDLCLGLAERIARRDAELHALPRQIIHSDLRPHNLLVDQTGRIIILDFDGMRLSQRGRDIAFAIYRLGRQFGAAARQSYDGGQAIELKKIFLGAYQTVTPIDPAEEQLLGHLLCDEFLRKLLFVLRSAYVDGQDTFRKEIPKFLAALREINYFWPEDV